MAGITIHPVDNPLSKYSSYSYTFSLYMISDKQHQQLNDPTANRSVSGYQLLIQSGGVGASAGKDMPARNPHFQEDFYIDDVEIKNLITGRANAGPAATHSLAFTVTEPYGITFIDRIKKASADFANTPEGASTLGPTHLARKYLMVVRFYGYDSTGKLLKGNNSLFSDSTAVYEKFFPFVMSEIKFRITNNLVEYRCQGVPIWNQFGMSTNTGVLPTQIEVSAATVGELLSGTSQQANSAKSVTRSLTDAVNTYYRENAAKGSPPNKIQIEFEGDIDKASLKRDGPTNLAATPATMSQAPADQLLDSKQSVKSTERNFSFASGTPIVQVIDQVVRSSSYIVDQQNVKITETKEVIPNPTANKPVTWFTVGGKVETQPDASGNPITNITYKVRPYQVYLDLPGFAPPEFKGTHKRYDYWFTGQNKEVLQFEQDYNFLFFETAAAQVVRQPVALASARAQEDKVRKVAQGGSAASTQGAQGGANDIAATAAASLYSLADQANCRLTIMGDPHWLCEYSTIETGQDEFLPDGSINWQVGQILMEINFNTPTDYNLQTGLMDVNRTNYNRNVTTKTTGDPTFSTVYMVYEVNSSFKDGKFTQEVMGTVKMFFDRQTNTAPSPASRPNSPAAGRAIQGGDSELFTVGKFGKTPPATTISVTQNPPNVNPTDSASGFTSPDTPKFGIPENSPTTVTLTNGTVVTVSSVAEVKLLRAQSKITMDDFVSAVKKLSEAGR